MQKLFLSFAFGTTRDKLKQSALSAILHMHRVTLKNDQVTDGPKAHLARWPQTNGQNNKLQTTALRANVLGITVYRQTKSSKRIKANKSYKFIYCRS